MRIVVTGATGFVGRHVVAMLARDGHEVVASARRPPTWTLPANVRFQHFDVASDADPVAAFGTPDLLVHLAWTGLPNYRDPVHVEQNLPASTRFIGALVDGGLKQVLVTGTCLEYGMREGCLSETLTARPATHYAIGKDRLRQSLEDLRRDHSFTLQWLRLFYTYGDGQNPKSLLAELDAAIARGDAVFNMSGGAQLRDYLPIEEVARRIADVARRPDCDGILNCCSGRPITVRHLVEEHIRRRESKIRMNLGYYPYPDHEPMRFWGDASRMECMRKAQ